MVRKVSFSGDAVGFLELGDLEAFAAEPDHHHAAHVRVGGSPGGFLQRVEDDAAIVDDAAIGLLEGDDAVDIADSRRECRSARSPGR